MIAALLEALGLRCKHKVVERVRYRPPALFVGPEGAKLKPGYLIRPVGDSWSEGVVTLDAEEALRFLGSASYSVSLIGVLTLPDGQVVQAQHFRPMLRLGVDVVIQEDGVVVEREECS